MAPHRLTRGSHGLPERRAHGGRASAGGLGTWMRSDRAMSFSVHLDRSEETRPWGREDIKGEARISPERWVRWGRGLLWTEPEPAVSAVGGGAAATMFGSIASPAH